MDAIFCTARPGFFHVCAWVKRVCLIGLIGLALAGCASVLPDDSSASGKQALQRQAVSDFYALVVAMNPQGLPTATELERLAPFMSDSLMNAFEQARLRQEADFARHGGTEPPLVQGSPFVSLFEGAREVINLEPGTAPDQWLVTLQYGSGTQAIQWADTAVLTQQAGRWVISDIRFDGQWDFARRGRLSEMLASVGQPAK